MENLLTLLAGLQIPFQKFDHPAVFSCDESDKLCPPMPGAHTKQLLMRSKTKDKYLLAIVMHDKRVDTRALSKEYEVQSFSFASPEDLKRLLGITPGAVTPFGLIYDKNHEIEVIFDEDAWNIGQFRFHPLTNTATLIIDQKSFKKFMEHTGHAFAVRSIPRR
jgi:Ala-tRNA(Pro) deacylase